MTRGLAFIDRDAGPPLEDDGDAEASARYLEALWNEHAARKALKSIVAAYDSESPAALRKAIEDARRLTA